MTLGFSSYLTLSSLSVFAIVGYAIQTREQFYPIILFLTTSKLSFLICGNMILATALLVGRVSKSLFLGQLREAELETLIEKAKYTIAETCFALTMFRSELSPFILFLFGVLLFLKSFHWLGKSRFEYLEQVIPMSNWTYIRFTSLLITLAIFDIVLTYLIANYVFKNGKSVLILFGFEFGVLIISIFSLSCRYGLFVLDNRFTNGLPSKGLYVMILDVFCEAVRCVTYLSFFGLLFRFYGMPIHLLREVVIAISQFHKKITSLIKYLHLTANLDQRFEDASSEEMTSAGDCLICREVMETGKKLPCSHVFHLDCLRMWLQHQQSCPLCRSVFIYFYF